MGNIEAAYRDILQQMNTRGITAAVAQGYLTDGSVRLVNGKAYVRKDMLGRTSVSVVLFASHRGNPVFIVISMARNHTMDTVSVMSLKQARKMSLSPVNERNGWNVKTARWLERSVSQMAMHSDSVFQDTGMRPQVSFITGTTDEECERFNGRVRLPDGLRTESEGLGLKCP